MLDHHGALICAMVIVSASDNDMTDAELRVIGDIVEHLPVFRDYPAAELKQTLDQCIGLLGRENGLEEALQQIKEALSPRLREAAYAMACDVAAADPKASQEEMRVLELLRHRLGLDRLIAAALERGTRARFATR
jgi:tellurite resistance protein